MGGPVLHGSARLPQLHGEAGPDGEVPQPAGRAGQCGGPACHQRIPGTSPQDRRLDTTHC